LKFKRRRSPEIGEGVSDLASTSPGKKLLHVLAWLNGLDLRARSCGAKQSSI